MEVWKTIPYFSKYKISSYGNIKNINNKFLKPHVKNSYYSVALIDDTGKRKGMLIHRLVAISFLSNDENKLTVNHKDHNKLNNNIDNLEWASNLEQNIHKRYPSKEKQELLSSRKILLTNKKTNQELTFDTMVYACKYIYDNTPELITKYETFDKSKSTLKSKVSRAIKNDKILFEIYKLSYLQQEIIDDEVWKKIPLHLINGNNNCYVSSKGRCKNNKGRITRGYIHTNGYTKVPLHGKVYAIHRLVAIVFIPNIENKEQINHKDGNKSNNSIENLEWITPSDNCIHRSNVLHKEYLKKVYQYDLNMNLIKEYNSLTNASKETNILISLISSCCNEKQVQTNGFIFRFEKNKNKSIINKHKKPIIQCDLHMTIITEFESITEASRKLNINNSCILECCKGRQKTSGGFIFRYK
jgi:hypothetical protein